MSDTANRRRHIHDIIARNHVRTQEQLLALLAAEDVHTTQATLSRDLRELGIRKGREGYRLPETPAAGRARRRQLAKETRGSIIRIDRTGGLVVIRTPPGMAQALALTLGRDDLPEVLGTIAGVDTVFVACTSTTQARALVDLLNPG